MHAVDVEAETLLYEAAIPGRAIAACYTGKYPTELVNIEELMSAKGRRG